MPTAPISRTRKLSVALTGFGGLDEPGPGASVAHALKQGWPSDLSISAWSYGSPANGAWLPGVVDRLQVLPPLAAGEEKVFAAIVEAHERAPVDVLIPCEADVVLIAQLADRLNEQGIRTLLPLAHHVAALTRASLPKFLHDRQVSGPFTINVSNVDDVVPLADLIGYPLYVRGVHFGQQVVYNAHQAFHAAEQLNGISQPGVMLQYQASGQKYSVGLVADSEGRCRALVTIKIVASNGEGRTVTGTIINLEHIERFALDFVKAAEWRGALTLELVEPVGYGQPLVCDVSSHLPTWCQASHWGGTNLAMALLKEILGLRRKVERPRPGTMFVRSVTELPIALDDLLRLNRHGRLDSFTPINGASHPRLDGEVANGGLVVAVTGTSTFDVVNPGLGVARALRQASEVKRIYGLAYGTLESGAYQPALFDEVFRLPDSGSLEALSRRIEDIHKAHRFDVLIPCLDGELPLFIKMRKMLDQLGIRYLLPDRKAFERRTKKKLFSGKLREDWGEFSIPLSRFARSKAETVTAVEAVGLPAVVKGPLFICFSANSLREATSAWQDLATAGWPEVIVQRKISGPHYATSIVCDREHKAVSALTIKKIMTCRRGSTWSAVRVSEPRLETEFSRFLHSIDWIGPAEGEFIRDELTDRFYLIEVNPRFTGWIFYSAALGCNQPRLAVRAAVGEAIDEPTFYSDVAFVRRMTEFPIRPSQLAALATKGYLRHV
jgi:biotin carboxylase